MIYVDPNHTWRFDGPSQTTAPNDVVEIKGFNGLVAMDFTQPMRTDDSISSIASAAVADITGTEPTISASAISSDKKKVELTLATASATVNTYTVNIKVVTVEGDTIVRKGRLLIR